MTDKPNSDKLTDLSPVKRALLEIRELRAKLQAIEQTRTEPIAIIGMGCRFPGGANNPATFWQLLASGLDAITEIPSDRWDLNAYYDPDPLAPGKMSTRWGGFLSEIDQFDAHFFGISPREAMDMDPQHRLFLEVSWEALEHAGQAPDELAGSHTGVFLGISGFDYIQYLFGGDEAAIDAYVATGNSHSTASGRLSYLLDLQGPTVSIDTACSSSLVAVHLAVNSLRNSECHLALVGGVNILLVPELLISFSKSQMLAADGRCKTFDARADGFVRAEGCGILVLKRLSEAVASGDNILAVIRGSAINQDGRSNGLTAPNWLAQISVIQEALANGRVQPSEVGYVEAHGTGTSLGDPIEVQALGKALCQDRSKQDRLLIGSVKTNLGHLEAAAGVAGLMKVVLALQHKEIPPHLHLRRPNHYIPWDELPIEVPTRSTPFPARNGRYVAGVSSFGFSGTNAHLVLEAAPDVNLVPARVERPLHLFTLSAKSEPALRALIRRYDPLLIDNQTRFTDVCFTTNSGRAHFSHRLAVMANSASKARERLAAFSSGKRPSNVVRGELQTSDPPKVAFLFAGQGSQYVGMGQQLYKTQPTFRAALDRCDEILRPMLDIPLLEILYPQPALNSVEKSKAHDSASPLDETVYTQPALFALAYALAKLWRSWGIKPDAVVGHSAGEYAAACMAGVFSLEDGLRLVVKRGQLTQSLPQAGLMAVVFAKESQLRPVLEPYAEDVSIAAINAPQNIVISGERQVIQDVLAGLRADGVRTQPLNISYGFHSPLVEPVLAEFEQTARDIHYKAPRLAYVSNLTGHMLKQGEVPGAAYWVRHLREEVRFSTAVDTLYQGGYQVYLEISPNPILLAMARRCVPGNVGVWLPSLRKKRDDWQQMLESLATLYVQGAEVDWTGFDRDYVGGGHQTGADHRSRRRTVLPTYPFQRQRYWVDVKPRRLAAWSQGPTLHPLLGQRLYLAGQETIFEKEFSLNSPSFLADYRVHGTVVVPTTAFLEMVLAAGNEILQTDAPIIQDMEIHQVLTLSEEGDRIVQLVLTPDEQGVLSFQILSREDEAHLAGRAVNSSRMWLLHASGKVQAGQRRADKRSEVLEDLQTRYPTILSAATHNDQLREHGMEIGPSFRSLDQIWQCETEALGRIRSPEVLLIGAGAYQLHPALLDGGLQLFTTILSPKSNSDWHQPPGLRSKLGPYLPVNLEHFQLHNRIEGELWSHVTIRSNGSPQDTLVGDVLLLDQTGRLVAEIKGLSLRRVAPEALGRSKSAVSDDWLYDVVWQLKPKELESPVVKLPQPIQIVEPLRDQVDRLRQSPEMMLAEELFPKFEALATAYMIQACRQLGWTMSPGQWVKVESLARLLGVIDPYRRLLARIIGILHEDGILEPTADGWQVCHAPEESDPQHLATTLLREHDDCQTEVRVASRCGQHLAQVLCGQQDPLELLFPGGSVTDLEQLYRNSMSIKGYNRLIQKVVSTMLAAVPPGQKIRILEIGGGTGGTTAYLLSQLPPTQVEYVFSDISPLFMARAQEKFESYPFVTYKTLDIERDPARQGFDGHRYDLILAANVLHATRNLRQSLEHVKSLLTLHGTLLLLEGTKPLRFVDLIFGLTEGWWRFEDTDLRRSYALLSPTQWLDLLQEGGFSEATTLAGQANSGPISHHAIILAKNMPVVDKDGSDELSEQPSDCWLIFADEAGLGHLLARRLTRQGVRCLLVRAGNAYEVTEPAHIKLDPSRLTDFQRLLSENFGAEKGRCQGIIHLWALDEPVSKALDPETVEESQLRICGSVLHLAQAILDLDPITLSGSADLPAVWLVTQGVQAIDSIPTQFAVAQAPLWGLGRVLSLEHPELWGGMIDLDPNMGPNELVSILCEEIWQSDAEDQVAFRGKERYVARLVSSPVGRQSSTAWRTDGLYLITGGLGYIGLKLARRLAEQGVGHLLLLGRSGLPERSQWAGLPPKSDECRKTKAIEAIEALGASVQVRAIDVGDYDQMSALFEHLGHAQPELCGVIHAAGVIRPAFIKDMTLDELRAVLRVKTAGTWVLHELCQKTNLDCFVMFSSGASVWGSKGLGHHAAANHFLDTMAHYRRALGLPGLSINWGWWAESHFDAEGESFLSQVGLEPMPAEEAIDVLEQLLAEDVTQKTVAAINWHTFKPVYETRRKRPLLAQIESSLATAADDVVERRSHLLLERLGETGLRERWDLLRQHVQDEVARVLGFDRGHGLKLNQGLFQLGMDSLMAVELKSRLETSLNHSLPATLTFDYPTIEALTGFLARDILGLAQAEDEQPAVLEGSQATAGDDMELERLLPDEVKNLLDDELTAVDRLIGDNSND